MSRAFKKNRCKNIFHILKKIGHKAKERVASTNDRLILDL